MAKNKKSNGEGSISFEADRKMYRARFTDPQGKRLSQRFKTKKEAKEWLAVLQADISKNTYVQPNSISLGSWMLDFLQTYKAPKVRPKTLERYMQSAAYLAPIANMPLQKLTAHNIQQFYNELPEMSPSSKNKIHKLLKSAVTKACAIDLLAKNFMLAVEAPPVPKVRVQVFTKEEIHTILHTIYTDQYYEKYYPFFLLAVTSGARLGELLGLKTKNIGKGYIFINNSLQYVKGKLVDMPPKTEAGERRITIPSNVESILKAAVRADKVRSFDGYTFHTRNGTPYSPRNMERIWKRVLQLAGIEHKNFHVLRHTMATQLLAEGVSIAEVAKRLGHSKISHTLNLYSHAIPDYDKEIPNIIEKIYAI